MIDSMFQDSTDSAIGDMVKRPTPYAPTAPRFTFGGLLKSPFQGLGAGASESIAFGAEITGAFGQVMAATDARPGGMFSTPDRKLSDAIVGTEEERARRKMLTTGIDYSNEAGDMFRQRAAEIMPDPQTTHGSAQVVAGLSKFLGKAVGYSFLGGPAAPIELGLDEGLTEADKLKQQGVDISTRTKAGAVAGTVAGASIVIPVAGSTALGTAGLVAAAGPGGFMAQNQATKMILENGGYKQIANQYDPLDPVGLALSTIVPAAFGAHAYRGARLKTQADVKEAVQLSPTEQASSDAFERGPANLAELEAAVQAEKNPQNRAILEAELASQRKAAVAHGTKEAMRADPDLEPAARVQQVADTIDGMRLTADGDLAGMSAHTDAMETAHAQIAAGERVDVSDILAGRDVDIGRVADQIPFDLAETLTPGQREIELQLAQRVAHDFEGARDDYAKLRDSEGGKVLNTDIARELSPAYLKDRTQSAAVHEPASYFTKKLYAERLKSLQPGERVVFTSGGTGAGKTTAIKGIPAMRAAVDDAHTIFDTNMNSLPSAVKKVEQALDAGADIMIVHVQRDPVEALTHGALTRAMHQEKEFGSGRTVPLREHARTHEGAAKVIQQLAERYKDDPRVDIQVIDNTRGKGGARVTDLGFVRSFDYTGLEGKLHDAVKAEHDAGRISEAVARATQGDERSGSGSVLRADDGGKPQRSNGSEAGGPPAAKVERASPLSSAAAEVAELHPDLMVQMDGQEPMRASDLLKQIKEEAADDLTEGDFVQAAVACLLRS